MEHTVETLHSLYHKLHYPISLRLHSFKKIWDWGDSNALMLELIYSLLTHQSNAHLCWEKALQLFYWEKLITASPDEISAIIHPVRFKHNKARYIAKAIDYFTKNSLYDFLTAGTIQEVRTKLVNTVLGIGYKEASHFLRNIGLGFDLAILDRHIVQCLVDCNVIPEFPKALTPSVYCQIEQAMQQFGQTIQIPMAYLDFIFWYREKGELFK